MKFVIGLLLIVVLAEQSYASDNYKKIVFGKREPGDWAVQGRNVIKLPKPESTGPPPSAEVTYHVKVGEYVNYYEILLSEEPLYEGAYYQATWEHSNPPVLTIKVENSIGKGLDAKVLIYAKKIEANI